VTGTSEAPKTSEVPGTSEAPKTSEVPGASEAAEAVRRLSNYGEYTMLAALRPNILKDIDYRKDSISIPFIIA